MTFPEEVPLPFSLCSCVTAVGPTRQSLNGTDVNCRGSRSDLPWVGSAGLPPGLRACQFLPQYRALVGVRPILKYIASPDRSTPLSFPPPPPPPPLPGSGDCAADRRLKLSGPSTPSPRRWKSLLSTPSLSYAN